MIRADKRGQPGVVLYTEYTVKTSTYGLIFDPDNDDAWISSSETVPVRE